MVKYKMNLQLFADDENVTMYEAKDGKVPGNESELIVKEVMNGSKTMQLAKFEEMVGKIKKFGYFAKGPGAYWVGEGQKIQTSKPQWVTAEMRAHKLAVIIPCSKEYLHYKKSDFFEVMKPKIAEAMYRKFDEATILNMDNPFVQSVEQSVVKAGTTVSGALNYDKILELEDKLTDGDFDYNAFISTKKNRSTLRNAKKVEGGVVTEILYDRAANTLDGQPVADLKSLKKGTIYAGDFDYMRYGIPAGMTYSISEDAQLSTIVNPDGTPVNLFEQDLVALKVTMDVAFMIIKDEAFARLGEATEGLGALTVNSSAGEASGDTAVTVTQSKGKGNIYKYKVADAKSDVNVGQYVQNWTAWDGTSDITAETGKVITVVEADKDYRALKAGHTTVTAQA